MFNTSCLYTHTHTPPQRHKVQCKRFLPVAGLAQFRNMIREKDAQSVFMFFMFSDVFRNPLCPQGDSHSLQVWSHRLPLTVLQLTDSHAFSPRASLCFFGRFSLTTGQFSSPPPHIHNFLIKNRRSVWVSCDATVCLCSISALTSLLPGQKFSARRSVWIQRHFESCPVVKAPKTRGPWCWFHEVGLVLEDTTMLQQPELIFDFASDHFNPLQVS